MKNAVEPLVCKQLPQSQAGGKSGKCVGTDFPNHTLRMMQEWARAVGKSTATLFLDLTQAFDRVVRVSFLITLVHFVCSKSHNENMTLQMITHL